VVIRCPKCNAENPDSSRFCADCGTRIVSEDVSVTKTLRTPTKGFKKDTVIAKKYKIIDKIGEGGMGVVYKAEDTRLDRSVALKFLPSELTRDKEAKKRFIQEAKAAASLNHPHICTIYEIDEVDDQTFISMECIEGHSLKDKLESGPFDIDEAKDIAMQAATGLKKAHKKGIVHRDIKPANIMLNEEGQAKITDFGLAKLSWGADLTKPATIMGTVAYMSPEQARGEEVDHRTDIWSLGAMLYEMLTGKRPFEKDQEHALIYSILNENPKPITSLRPDIPIHIKKMIEKSLAKNVDERYQSINEFISDLKPASISPPIIEKSIAVMPFANMSADPEQMYFCEGISEEIINALTQVRDLRVVARTSAFAFRGKDIDIREIGKKLNVNNVLEGSVRKSGNRLRITAQLINVADGYHLWSERFDRDMEDIFAIQDEISLAIAEKLKLELLGEEKSKLTKRYTEDVEAYNLYLKGNYFCQMYSADGFTKAIECFEQALQKDPGYALAHVGIANTLYFQCYFIDVPPNESIPKGKKHVEKALDIDENLAEAHATLGQILSLYDWDWKAAEKEFKRALGLNQNSADIHRLFSTFLSVTGEQEKAVVEIKRACELDPLNINYSAHLGERLLFAGQVDEAIDHLKKTTVMAPQFFYSYAMLGYGYVAQSKIEEAIAAYEKAFELSGGMPSAVWALALAYFKAGRKSEAEKLFNSLKERAKKKYMPPTFFISLHKALGDLDQAYKWLEKACDEHDIWLPFCLVFTDDDMRLPFDQRSAELLKKKGSNQQKRKIRAQKRPKLRRENAKASRLISRIS